MVIHCLRRVGDLTSWRQARSWMWNSSFKRVADKRANQATGEHMRVIFLGAGASKAMGLLLTAELLPMMVQYARHGRLFSGLPNATDKSHRLLELVAELLPGVDEMTSLPSIIDVL